MNRLQKFITDNWAMQPHDFEWVASLVLPCVVKGNIEQAIEQLQGTGITASATGPYLAKWWELDDMALPADSVAVVKLYGPLYSWESVRLIEIIAQAEANPNICGIVFEIDGPGGMVSHLDQACMAIENCSKPTATVVTGVMASAHFWLGTAADRTFIASPLCEVGSVGVVITHYSLKKYYEQNGIDYREIYPDTADLKNKEVRALVDDGDDAPLKARAEKIHMVFAAAVAAHLGIEHDKEHPLFRGEMFDGTEAVANGYIDEMGSVADAVRWVLAQATSRKVSASY